MRTRVPCPILFALAVALVALIGRNPEPPRAASPVAQATVAADDAGDLIAARD